MSTMDMESENFESSTNTLVDVELGEPEKKKDGWLSWEYLVYPINSRWSNKAEKLVMRRFTQFR